MLLAMLAIAESRRVQQYIRLVNDPDLNSGVSASRAGGATANSSPRSLELKTILADPRFVTQQMDILLPKLQGEVRTLSGEVATMMADPLLQEQAALIAEQLKKVIVDDNLQKQAEHILEQAEEVVTQMQTIMRDPRLQGEAERLAKQMEQGMGADGKPGDNAKTLAKWAVAMEATMSSPSLHEHARRLFKQLEAMDANLNFQDQATTIAQLMETLMADPNFQRHAKRIATHVEAILELTQEEFVRFLTEQMDILLTQIVGPKLQEEIRTLIGVVGAMMADPLLQDQATLVAEQLEKVMYDANFQEQVKQVLEQAVELVTQIQAMMTDPRLQGEAEIFAKQMEEGMSADGKPWDHAMEVIMGNPRLHEHARRLFKQLKRMKANQNFQDRATSIAQLMETLMADPNFQSHARRIAAHVEAVSDHLTSQKTDGGLTLDLSSLAEVNRSSSGVSFVPLRPLVHRPVAVASHSAPLRGLRSHIHMSQPRPASGIRTPRWRHLVAPWRYRRALLAPPRGRQSHSGSASAKGAVMSAGVLADGAAEGDAENSLRARILDTSTKTANVAASNTSVQARTLANRIRSMMSSLVNARKLFVAASSAILLLPSIAQAASLVAPLADISFDNSFWQALSLIFVSELGDKTFFIAALLAARASKLLTFVGCAGALAVMTVLSVAIGQVFHSVPNSLTGGLPLDDYVAIVSFLYFGVKSLREALSLKNDGEGIAEELEDAKKTLVDSGADMKGGWPLVVEASTLTLLAEVGDRSQLATIALGAAGDPIGVALGGTVGHFIATGLAVLGGSFLSKYFSERAINIVGGVLFIFFAATTLLGVLPV